MRDFKHLLPLEGLEFVRSLLEFEQRRFRDHFRKGSVFEDINKEFGIFPDVAVYPAYFAGNLREPEGKHVFIGINPGYNHKNNQKEQAYLDDKESLFDGYCDIFRDFFPNHHKGLGIKYFASVVSFLRHRYGKANNDWVWLHDNLINLDLIPYHSLNAAGIRINNLSTYKTRYLTVIEKILAHIKPDTPVFINGYPGFAGPFSDPELQSAIDMQCIEYDENRLWVGTLFGRYRCFGLPFLTRVKGGIEALAKQVIILENDSKVWPKR